MEPQHVHSIGQLDHESNALLNLYYYEITRTVFSKKFIESYLRLHSQLEILNRKFIIWDMNLNLAQPSTFALLMATLNHFGFAAYSHFLQGYFLFNTQISKQINNGVHTEHPTLPPLDGTFKISARPSFCYQQLKIQFEFRL